MPKTREQKKQTIKDLDKNIKAQKAIVLVGFEGLESKKLFELRNELKKSDCLLKVAKKTLIEKTLETLGEKEFAAKIREIKGQIAMVFGFSDEVIAAKICQNFSEKNEALKIVAGVLGKEFLEKSRVVELAKLPSRSELLSRLLGSLQSPIANFANVLQGNIKGLLNVLIKIKT